MLLPYFKIEKEISLMLNNWFNFYDQFSLELNAFFGAIFNNQMFMVHIFQSHVQALESYERKKYGTLQVL